MYVYIAGWNLPGCLPDSPPAAFDNEKAARDYMCSEFRRFAQETFEGGDIIGADKFAMFADMMEFHGDAAMGKGDSYWDGPDGLVYFIECVDWTDEEWREYREAGK